MKSPQEYILNWSLTNSHNIFVNLNKEKYWLVWTDKNNKIWNFEHNSLSNVPNRDYDKIIKILNQAGYEYAYKE